MHDPHWTSQSPLAVLKTLPEHPSHDEIKNAHKFWVEHEARRRVLQAALILDVQQSTLFGQPSVLLQRTSGSSHVRKPSVEIVDLPFPCDSNLWETWHLEDWLKIARSHSLLPLTSAAATAAEHGHLNSRHLDPFQSTLLLAHNLTKGVAWNCEAWLTSSEGCGQYPPLSRTPLSQSCTLFTYHALMAARHTPLHALLTVSGESWLFNRKIPNEEDFRKAKDTLKTWASDTEDIRKAVWHAVRVLDHAIHDARLNALFRDTVQSNIRMDNAINTTGTGYGPMGSGIPRSTPASRVPSGSFPAGPGTATQPGPLAMLHANWALYISALICWAYGFDPSTSTISASYSPNTSSRSESAIAASSRSYISTMISLAPTWQQLSHTRIPVAIRCNTLSLLEFIRTTRLQEGRMGGLLNEGERVLARLAETRPTANSETRGMWEF